MHKHVELLIRHSSARARYATALDITGLDGLQKALGLGIGGYIA